MGWQVFSLSLCLLFLCHGSTADQFSSPWMSSRRGVPSQQQCRLERLNALEPKRKVESEAGITEYFDENDDQCQCAGLAANRRTIQSKGLVMPFYSNAHRLVYILQGSGIAGGVLPGCPETFQQSFEQQEPRGQGQQQKQEEQQGQQGQQQSKKQQQGQQQGEKQQQQGQKQQGEKQQQGQQQQQSQRPTEQHQRVIRFRQGDVLAVPAGMAHWIYNDGDSSVVAITVLDTGNSANQLDNNPRKFSLAGQSSKEEERSANNIFSGFDLDFLAQALGISRRLAQKLQQGQRGEIVRVERELRMVMPPRSRSEEQQQEEEEESSSSSSNGLEQIFCTLRFRENIDNPSRADVYNPQAGRYTHLNGQKLPILNHIQMSATRGVLNQGAILAPHWNINAHSLVYITKGRGRIQIVGDQGQSAFDDELRQGQMVLVPQHYAVVMQARDERFEWIAFKTHANAIANQIVGPGSLFRGLPEDIITNSYRGLSRDEARALKNSISLVIPTTSRGPSKL